MKPFPGRGFRALAFVIAWTKLLCVPYEVVPRARSNSYRTMATFGAHRHFPGNTNVKLTEPPSCRSPSTIVFIGCNSRGQGGAQEQNGLFGGLFVSRAQAVKYA